MPDISETRGLLAKNADVRQEMLRRKDFSSHNFFYIEGKEEYQDIFSPNNKLEDTASLRYANLMSLNAVINKGRFLNDKYITPNLTEFYGSNPQISGNIGYYNIYAARNGQYDKEDGRIIDDYGVETKFIKVEGNPLSDSQYYFLKRNLEKAKKIGFEENGVNYTVGFTPNSEEEYGRDFIDTVEQKIIDEDKIDNISHENVIVDTIERKPITPYSKEKVTEILENLKKGQEINDTIINGRKTLFSATDALFKNNLLRTPENTQSKNLPKKNNNSDFCRNWNRYKKYNDSLKNLMGNYKNNEGEILSIQEIQEKYKNFRGKDGISYLSNNTVLEDTGFINIVRRPGYKNSEGSIKKCMFSIENLAWKDVPKDESLKYLNKEQIGPNGGRIMWFPPYDISFSENVNVQWNDNTFIGRGEKVYTYTNTDRTGQLDFLLLIDHPNIINAINKKAIEPEDVLRFFNGEQLLTEAKIKEEPEPEPVKPTNNEPEIEEVPVKSNKEIRFSIYFPNNYSGMFMFDEEDYQLNERDFYQNHDSLYYIDDDWWIYLLIGRNTGTDHWVDGHYVGSGVLPPEWRGYEMWPNKTIEDGQSDPNALEVEKEENIIASWKALSDSEVDTLITYKRRVDYDMRQRFSDNANYSDKPSGEALNSYIPFEQGEHTSLDAYTFLPAAEVLTAIAKFAAQNEENRYDMVVSYLEGGVGDAGAEERIDKIVDYLKNGEITNITIHSHAPSIEGGNADNSETIAFRRAYIVKNFLEKNLKDAGITNDTFSTVSHDVRNSNETDVNSDYNKKQRRVDVIISLTTTEIVKLSDLALGNTLDGDNIIITDNVTSENENSTTNSNENEEEGNEEEYVFNEEPQRYETEAEYFQRISNSEHVDKIEGLETRYDKMQLDKIREKISVFNPAFHSISPEGFNARLTFLQQCTRQGHTIEASDRNGFATTAGNLAFGRMPVCVLSIGDFINTRIIINSMSINYSDDGMQWDLNKTGVGVQPMFAKVSLSIVMLGGQSLTGPISKLQNAVSFNYYANTGVYDDRADRVTGVDENGNSIYNGGKPLWTPTNK